MKIAQWLCLAQDSDAGRDLGENAMAISKSEKTAALIIGIIAVVVVSLVAVNFLSGPSLTPSITTTATTSPSGTVK
ncbi:MAG: hypothetical protein ABUL48_05305 [Pseudorhodoplanes sp.]